MQFRGRHTRHNQVNKNESAYFAIYSPSRCALLSFPLTVPAKKKKQIIIIEWWNTLKRFSSPENPTDVSVPAFSTAGLRAAVSSGQMRDRDTLLLYAARIPREAARATHVDEEVLPVRPRAAEIGHVVISPLNRQ